MNDREINKPPAKVPAGATENPAKIVVKPAQPHVPSEKPAPNIHTTLLSNADRFDQLH